MSKWACEQIDQKDGPKCAMKSRQCKQSTAGHKLLTGNKFERRKLEANFNALEKKNLHFESFFVAKLRKFETRLKLLVCQMNFNGGDIKSQSFQKQTSRGQLNV